MGKTKFDETYIFKISIKLRFFLCSYCIKIPSFRVSVTIEPGRSLLLFVTANCLISHFKIAIPITREKFSMEIGTQLCIV